MPGALSPFFNSARPGAGGGFRVSGATGQQGGEDLTQIDLQQKVLKSGDDDKIVFLDQENLVKSSLFPSSSKKVIFMMIMAKITNQGWR